MSSTKLDKVLTRMLEGQEFSAAQLKSRFGIANPGSTIEDIREKGYSVYANPVKNTKKAKYRIGRPNVRTLVEGADILGEDHPAVRELISAAFEQNTARDLGLS